MGKNKKANHSKREEEKANKIVKGIFYRFDSTGSDHYGRVCCLWIKPQEITEVLPENPCGTFLLY